MKNKKFNPLVFLASLGAGGIAVLPFVLMQYTVEHGPGLITRAQLWAKQMTGIETAYYTALEGIMIGFAALHFILLFWYGAKIVGWFKSQDFRDLVNDPLRNSTLMAPFITIMMTMNLFIGPIRYFLPVMSENFQAMMAPAFGFWLIIFTATLLTEVYLLGISFKRGFDINKIHFGWLLHPFALGMLSTVGSGIAAMAKSPTIANHAAFLTMIAFSMGVFLLVVKLVMIFKSHFEKDGLAEKNFLPSFLIVIPNVTLFAITAFRLGHFLEHHHGMHLDWYFYIVIGVSFAFEVWYMLFGLSLLYRYFRQHHFREYFVAQWGLICPFVAFVVLGAFAFKEVLPSPLLYGVFVVTIVATITFYIELLYKHIRCQTGSGGTCA